MANFDAAYAGAARANGAGGPGAMLRAARESEGISLRGMADRLNWSTAYVEAIEENRFDIFRSNLYIRGYVRAYARMLKLPEDEALAALDKAELPQDPALPAEESPPQLVVTPKQRPIAAIAAWVLLALSLALAVYLALRDDEAALPEEPLSNGAAAAVERGNGGGDAGPAAVAEPAAAAGDASLPEDAGAQQAAPQ